MINRLKQKSIQKIYNKTIVKKSVKNKEERKIKKVAILLDNESLENIVLANLSNKLSFVKENITVLIYREFSKKEEVLPKFFTNKDIGMKASLKSDNLKNFVKNDYDLLISYIKTPNLYTNMVTLLSQASLKTGFAGVDDRLYDLVISDEGFNEAVLNQELKKYLTILNKI
ncbi:DUF6913 domain-containing protein [Tenacibaculum soleae]|uniref:Uncharacterized protein n=1 Tax=Tenacibaculum soleae TaxID=447689 RepID=A0A1B9XYZ6_9FLAO|nr:hypothetical protein [Tenacibaculum soleae]MDO6812209.1 hypothetical protein [Tenacibaculum soleae]OCK42716.1 hypothetical protein BA195_07335 [Tenacibaculum soleae]